jgi:hypothetical protein
MQRKLWSAPCFEAFKSLKSCLSCLNKFSAALGALREVMYTLLGSAFKPAVQGVVVDSTGRMVQDGRT